MGISVATKFPPEPKFYLEINFILEDNVSKPSLTFIILSYLESEITLICQNVDRGTHTNGKIEFCVSKVISESFSDGYLTSTLQVLGRYSNHLPRC
jgi:hypothetical protein